MNQLLNRWRDIVAQIKVHEDLKTPLGIFNELTGWSDLLRRSKNKSINELYILYLGKFQDMRFEDYSLNGNHRFDELVKYDLLNQFPSTLEHATTITRDILWNIVAYHLN